jgi:hypothetical protein
LRGCKQVGHSPIISPATRLLGVEDEAADRVMAEADAITRLNDLGFADVRIAYRRHMDAVLIAHKPWAHR